MRGLICLAVLLLCVAGCGDDPVVTPVPVASAVVITSDIDRVPYRNTAALAAEVIDTDQEPVAMQPIAWTTSDSMIARVSPSGVVSGVWPGLVTIYARSGALMDSIRMVVHTDDDCFTTPWHVVPFETHGFAQLRVEGGLAYNRTYVGATLPYRGTQLLWGAGVAYGTNAHTTVTTDNSAGPHRDLYGKRVCSVPSATGVMYTVSLLQPYTPDSYDTWGHVPGLAVVQEQFAFEDAANDDYILYSYTFSNFGTSVITGLRFGAITDFDVVAAPTNVASYDPATGIADAISSDSIAHPQSVGFKLIGVETAAYDFGNTRGAASQSTTQQRVATMYSYLSSGFDVTRSGVMDVWQLLGTVPFDLQPGASKRVWYAIAGGNNRAEMTAHMQAAEAKVAALQ